VSWSSGIYRTLHNDVQSTESASSQVRTLKLRYRNLANFALGGVREARFSFLAIETLTIHTSFLSLSFIILLFGELDF